MYDINTIKGLVEEKIKAKGFFIVEIIISHNNKISVFLDSEKGINIDDCVEISRFIESNLDREKEDFELEVSSAGIGYPFKVEKQYLKNLDKEVEVLINRGEKMKGVLKSYSGDSIGLEVSKMVKIEGKKKKTGIKETIHIQIENIKSIKHILSI